MKQCNALVSSDGSKMGERLILILLHVDSKLKFLSRVFNFHVGFLLFSPCPADAGLFA